MTPSPDTSMVVSPVAGSRVVVGVTHLPILRSVAAALVGSDSSTLWCTPPSEAPTKPPLDSGSALVRVGNARTEVFSVSPESVSLPGATRTRIPWIGPEDEARQALGAPEGEEGPACALIFYNAALRLWIGDETLSHREGVNLAREALRSGAAAGHLGRARRLVSAGTPGF